MQNKLQYISQERKGTSHVEAIRAACEAGCKWIQLRVKDKTPDEIVAIGRQVRPICTQYNAVFILNDHLDLVKLVEADGVHLGKLDASHASARQQLGKKYIIGGTANTIEDIAAYAREGAVNYVGVGPFRHTTTKKNLSPILGLQGYQDIVGQCKSQGIELPLIAIGGILLKDIDAILQTGMHGIAVSGLITHALEKEILVQQIHRILATE